MADALSRLLRTLWLGTLLVATAREAAAVTVRVAAPAELKLPDVIPATVRRVDGNATESRNVLLHLTSPTELDLGEQGTWEIAVDLPRVWAEPVYVTGRATLSIALWPRASLTGTIKRLRGEDTALTVDFSPASSTENTPSGKAACSLEAEIWTCAVPAGEHDLRFSRTGYATEFRWQVKVPRGAVVPVGELRFTPGSSVFGRLEMAGASTRDVLATVTLVPRNAESSGSKLRTYTGTADKRGFFQVRGLPPGEYELRGAAKDFVSDVRSVTVIARTNAELREPLVLGPPLGIDARLDPPLAPDGKRWQVHLHRTYGSRADLVTQASASMEGKWAATRLPPGDYLLSVRGQDGADWKQESVQLRSGDPGLPLHVRVEPERVRGTVLLGQRPLAATVHFGGEYGVTLTADEAGRFAGAIPRQARDEAIVTLVTSDVPNVKRTVTTAGRRADSGELNLDIQLPSTVLTGRTLNRDGSTEPHAIVTIRSGDDAVFEQMFSASDASFQFEGFPPGAYTLQAEGFRKRSSVADVDVEQDAPASVELVLDADLEIRGTVSMGGAPVTGADVYAFPRGVRTAFLPNATSDATGRFSLRLPPEASTLDVIVIPRGFYVTAARLVYKAKKDVEVRVGQDGGALTVLARPGESPTLRTGGAEFSLDWLVEESGGTSTNVDGQRVLTVPHLEPGTYSVCVPRTCGSIFLPRLAKAVIDLTD